MFDVEQLLNTAATGAVTLSATDPVEGTELAADVSTIADADGVGDLTITWQAGNETDGFAAVGEGAGFTPTAAEIGLLLRVVVTFVDGDGVPEQVVSEVTSPVADDPAIGGGTTDPGTGGGTGGGDRRWHGRRNRRRNGGGRAAEPAAAGRRNRRRRREHASDGDGEHRGGVGSTHPERQHGVDRRP